MSLKLAAFGFEASTRSVNLPKSASMKIQNDNWVGTIGNSWGNDFVLKAASADSVKWKYRVVTGGIEITGIEGKVPPSLTIPSVIGGYTVVSIGPRAFYNCLSLKSVTIPASVKNIEEDAFSACDNLESVYVESGDSKRIRSLVRGSGYDVSRLEVTVENAAADACLFSDLADEEWNYFTAAVQYAGYIRDEAAGKDVGYVTVKCGKASRGVSKVSATVIRADGSKLTFSGNHDDFKSILVLTAKDRKTTLALILGEHVLTGLFEGNMVYGMVNGFASKDKTIANNAKALLKMLGGAYALRVPDASGTAVLSVSISSSGKVKVSGNLSNGTKVSVGSQLVVGYEWSCIPVFYAKKSNRLGITLWLKNDGTESGVYGVKDAVFGRTGELADGARFRIDRAALVAALGDDTYADYLPDDFTVTVVKGKWTFPKAGKVTLKNGVVDTSKLGFNPSGLKLTYTAKSGVFKGSFKAYVDNRGKPKAVTVTVNGIVVGGRGIGTASCKKPNFSIPIKIK